jgi:hypothetical protein
MISFESEPSSTKRQPAWRKRQACVKFHDQYDATFYTLYEHKDGRKFWLYRHMRCCFGSKVTIDTWMRPIKES